MRSTRKVPAIVGILILLPLLTATTAARPPSGRVSLAETDFKPVPGPLFTPSPAPTPPDRVVEVIVDRLGTPPPRPAAPRRAPQPKPRMIVVTPKMVGVVRVSGGSHSIRGDSSWYCSPAKPVCAAGYPPGSMVAAAGPKLRVAMGGGVAVNASQPWKGKMVYVDGVPVKIVDWCQCLYRTSDEKVIDLYFAVWQKVGGNVTIRW